MDQLYMTSQVSNITRKTSFLPFVYMFTCLHVLQDWIKSVKTENKDHKTALILL